MNKETTAMQSAKKPSPGNPTEKFYTVKEAAEMLNRPAKTLWDHVYSGKLKVQRTNGKNPRISQAELECFASIPPQPFGKRFEGRELEILNYINDNGGMPLAIETMRHFGVKDDYSWGNYIIKIARKFHFRMHHSPTANLNGGDWQLWLRLHQEEIVAFHGEHGTQATLLHFRIKAETLEKVLNNELHRPFVTPLTETDKLELRVSCLHDEVRSLRSEIADLKQSFHLFQQGVAGDITKKFLIPLLELGIRPNPEIEELAKSDPLSLVDFPK
jgi:excisionase family DNA binding protein